MTTFNIGIESGPIEGRIMYWLVANIDGSDYLSDLCYSSDAACLIAFLAGDVVWFKAWE